MDRGFVRIVLLRDKGMFCAGGRLSMGVWSYNLYGNDITCDVKERALDFLNKGEGRALFDNQNKWVKTLDKPAPNMQKRRDCLTNYLMIFRLLMKSVISGCCPVILPTAR